MSASPAYDRDGYLCTEAEEDRCAHYLPKSDMLRMNRCVCCVSFDAQAGRCRNEKNRIDPLQRKEAHDGT